MASIYKRSWKAANGERRVAWRVDFTDQYGKRGTKQFSTKREADGFRVQTEARLMVGTFRADAGRHTIDEIAKEYLNYAKGRANRGERFTQGHFDTINGLVNNHILSSDCGMGGLRLTQITARSVGDFRIVSEA